jgi:hypothetical protein
VYTFASRLTCFLLFFLGEKVNLIDYMLVSALSMPGIIPPGSIPPGIIPPGIINSVSELGMGGWSLMALVSGVTVVGFGWVVSKKLKLVS